VRGPATVELRRLFSPLALVALMYVPLLALFAATSPSIFSGEFLSVKHLTTTSFAYFTAAIFLFACGAALGGRMPLRRPLRHAFEQSAREDGYRVARLAPFLHATMLVAALAYLTWFAVGVARAGGPSAFITTWLDNPFAVKTELLRTIPGVTTLTQLSVAAVPLALAFGLLGRGGKLRGLAVLLVVLATARSFLFSERLALLEVVVPILYLLLSERRVTVPKALLYSLAAGTAILVVFTAAELRRTYVYSHNFSVPRVTARFLGYYLTSIDNGSTIIDEYPAATPFANTGQILWRFPGVSAVDASDLPPLGTVSLRYTDLFGVDPDPFWREAFAEQGLNYEYNVFTTPGFLAADFGWFALPLFLLLGLYSGALYRRARTSPLHRALYAVWFVGLLEFMRIFYFLNTRVFPAYLVFMAVYVSIARRVRVEDTVTPLPGGARPVAAPTR
jgi:oligosaccharide repeat unit polymerase